MARHGARSHYKKTEVGKDYWGPGVKPGYVTRIGRMQFINSGLARRREYIQAKGLLSADYNQHEILSMSTFKQRCAVSGHFFFHGLYPLVNTAYSEETQYQDGDSSPLIGTNYEKTLVNMEAELQKCQAGPVIQVPHHQDIMMHTRNCKTVHNYLNKDQWDMKRLEAMLEEDIGKDIVDEYKQKMKAYWKEDITNIRDYFEMLDARVAELKQAGGSDDMHVMQRQECFILANNFVGDDDTPGNVYLYRMIDPILKVLTAKMYMDIMQVQSDAAGSMLKYLIFNLHDTNVSNFLRYLGYWKMHGFKKFVKFGSTVRLELIKQNMKEKSVNPRWEYLLEKEGFLVMDTYLIRIVYDDEEIRLPFCESNYCSLSEFINHMTDSLELNVDIESYCDHGLEQPMADKKI